MSFWGKVCGGVSGVAGAYAGMAKGVYNVASGNGTFSEAVEEVAEKAATAGEKFGDEHGKAITNTVIGLAGTVATNEYKRHRT